YEMRLSLGGSERGIRDRDHTADVANATAPSRFTLLPQSILDHVLQFLSLHDRVVLERKICHALSQRLQACAAADAALMLTTNIWTAAMLRTQLDALPQSDLPAVGRARAMAGMLARVPELPADERWSAIEAVLERLDTVSGALAPVMDALAAYIADPAGSGVLDEPKLLRLAQAVAMVPVATGARARIAVLGRAVGPQSTAWGRGLAAMLLPDAASALAVAHALPASEQLRGLGQLLAAVMARSHDHPAYAQAWSALLAAATAEIRRDAAFATRLFCALLARLPGGPTTAHYHGQPPSPDQSLQHWLSLLNAAAALPGDADLDVARASIHTAGATLLNDPDRAATATASLLAHLEASRMDAAQQLHVRAELVPYLPPPQQGPAWHALWDEAERRSLPSLALLLVNILHWHPCDPVRGWQRAQSYCLSSAAPTPEQRAALLCQAGIHCAPGTAIAETMFHAVSELALRHHQFLPLVRWVADEDDQPADRILSVIWRLPPAAQARAFSVWLDQRGWVDELLPELLPLARQLQAAGCWPELSEMAAAWALRCSRMLESGPTLLPCKAHAAMPQLTADMLGVLEDAPPASHTPQLLADMAQLTSDLWLQGNASTLIERAWNLIDRLDAQAVRTAMDTLHRRKQTSLKFLGDDDLLLGECWARPTLLRATELVRTRFTAPERRRWLARLVEAEGRMGDFRPDVERNRFDAVRQALWLTATALPTEAVDAVRPAIAPWFAPASRDPLHLEAWQQAAAQFRSYRR
ncbi:hypothetical protein J5T34_09150, partial [Cupriavidus gilardii]|uniref:hypothetical protein n=1 Tax=Cupriavidus gilardii TaxID=82541 RepID=UPI001ABD9DD4